MNEKYANCIPENVTKILKPDLAYKLSDETLSFLNELFSDGRHFLCNANPDEYLVSHFVKELCYEYDFEKAEAVESVLEDYSFSNELIYQTEDIIDALGDSEAEDFLYNHLSSFCDNLHNLGFAAKCENLLDFVSDAFTCLILNICE